MPRCVSAYASADGGGFLAGGAEGQVVIFPTLTLTLSLSLSPSPSLSLSLSLTLTLTRTLTLTLTLTLDQDLATTAAARLERGVRVRAQLAPGQG